MNSKQLKDLELERGADTLGGFVIGVLLTALMFLI